MSALVLSCRTGTSEDVIEELYRANSVIVPKMPSLGLLLEEPVFESYNTRMGVINEKLEPSSPDYRPPIDFEVHRAAINAFKQKYIYDNMRNVEDRYGLYVLSCIVSKPFYFNSRRSFDSWIRSVDSYNGSDLLYLNSKGVIPAAAVIKKGEKRENPFREQRKFNITSFSMNEDDTKLASDTKLLYNKLVVFTFRLVLRLEFPHGLNFIKQCLQTIIINFYETGNDALRLLSIRWA